MYSETTANLDVRTQAAREKLDAWVRDVVAWHFDPATGCPFWLDYANKLGWDPRTQIRSFADLSRLGWFEDDWLRGGPVQRWIPKGMAGQPVYVFETGGTTGTPKTRVAVNDFRTDYELFSDTLPDEYFPKGANWLMLGPSGPRRLRLSVEHLAQYRGGVCFCVDLDPRWVITLIKKGWTEHLQAYKDHCIDGNTLMGLAASAPSGPENGYKITYYAPQPRAVIEVVDFDDPSRVVEYGDSGRVKLTTLTKEFFIPGFLERDEGEREPPCTLYPWDGASGVRPFRGVAQTTTVGVY